MKWTLVTGAAKGLGAAISLELASKGLPIVIHYNKSKDLANSVAEECSKLSSHVEILQGDFSTIEGVELFLSKYLEKFPETQNLINNVGNYLIKSASETVISEWLELFQANFFAPLHLMKSLIPSISEAKGSIINIGVTGIQSVAGDIHATAYMTTKLSLWMVTRSLAKELVAKGIRVNMISPGHLENSVDLPPQFNDILETRPAKLKEVATLVSFLLDKEHSYITGQDIEVGGGFKL